MQSLHNNKLYFFLSFFLFSSFFLFPLPSKVQNTRKCLWCFPLALMLHAAKYWKKTNKDSNKLARFTNLHLPQGLLGVTEEPASTPCKTTLWPGLNSCCSSKPSKHHPPRLQQEVAGGNRRIQWQDMKCGCMIENKTKNK